MNCPSCHKQVKDDAQICPHCDHIIDASFLGDVSGDADDDADPTVRPSPTAPAANRWAKYYDEEAEDTKNLPKNLRSPKSAGAKADVLGSDRVVGASEQLEGMLSRFKSLCFEDKVTFVAGALTTIMIFMPWRNTAADGDELGLLSLSGLLCLVFVFGAIVAIFGRTANYFPSLPRSMFPLLSVGFGGLVAITAIATGISSIDRTQVQGPLGATPVTNSMPAFGVWLTVVCAAGVIVGGILSFKRINAES
jgi:hypothetical protein